MANFIRRFLFDPGLETLLDIESVNILDLEPPAELTGVGSGTVLCVAEYENGPFVQREVSSASDFKTTFGTFGYEYDGMAGGNPCARTRKADGVLSAEYWNGNGFVALANKKFRRLICVRVDTSVGEVQFTRLAAISGGADPTFALTTGQKVTVDAGAGAVDATFTGAPAVETSAAGVYPTLFTGGEKMNVTIDLGVPGKQIGPVDIVFQAGDQSHAQVVARINSVLGYTAAAVALLTTTLTGRVGGTGGSVVINSIDASVGTATGFAAGTTAGTGNVANISAVTVAEVNTVVNAAESDVSADRDAQGRLRLYNTVGTTLDVTAATTAIGFGFTLPSAADSAVGTKGTIAAGTRVQDSSANEWVTMQDLTVLEDSAGPYSVKVRPATDDGTALGSASATVEVLPYALQLGAFAVTNALPLTASLTEAQIDARYADAIAKTKVLGKVGEQSNIIIAARQSNTVRVALRSSALEASAEGCFGRMAVIRPPLGTTRADAVGSGQPSVATYREQRVVYAYPGVQTYLSQIASRGSSGGDGFTDDGIVDVGFDGFVASVMSQLPPEENPGQITTFLTGVLGLEAGNADVQDMEIGDYQTFRRNGIAAPRMDNGVAIIQSGVTSVNPLTNPNLRNIARRRMADQIQDTLSIRLKAFGKKLNSRSRRAAIVSEVRSYLRGLQDGERIDSFSVVIGSDVAQLALGVFRLIIKVKTFSSLDSIVLETTIGETVTIEEAA